MANIKFSEDLFLEQQELNRFKRFLTYDGYKQQLLINTETFGIVKGFNLPNGTNTAPKDSFLVDNIGAATNSINIRPGRAIDKYANIISLNESRTVSVPNNGLWYWVKIKYRTVNEEIGKVSIDANGNLSGFGTEFTSVLRGQPNFPAKIKFTGSLQNNLEYEVVDVVNDSSAIISGDFIPETDLQYSIVGTFTPGYVPLPQNKMIFEYDDVEISLISENPSSPGIAPAKLDDEEFYIARLRTAGLNIEIQDKRLEFWKTKAEYELQLITRFANPIIGCESVKWDIATTPRDRNEVNIVWGYRSTNWSVDTTQNLVTINAGEGGILKENDLTLFDNAMFDGWRLYTKSGKYFRVVSSTKSGTQLNLKLDYLDFAEFNAGDQLHIVPDVEEIEIRARYNSLTGINHVIEDKFVFPIYFSGGKCYVRITDSKLPYLYNFTYRYKTVREYTDWFVFPNDPTGHYSEDSFEDNGILKANPLDRTLKPYNGSLTNGFIEIVPNPRNFNILFEELITGDKFGVDHKDLTNASINIDLVVGRDRQMQVFHADDLTLFNDININLNKIRSDGTHCINGNRFIIQIEGEIKLNGRNLRVVTDYTDPVTFTPIRDILSPDIHFIKQNQQKQRSGLVMIFSYDGTDWWLSISNEFNGVPQKSIVAYGGNLSDFDSTGLGIADEVLGWALCNGNYGTRDLRGKATVGYSNTDSQHSTPYATGGSKNIYISKQQLPNYNLNSSPIAHSHQVWGKNASRNTSGSGYDINQVHKNGPTIGSSAVTNTTSNVANVTINSGGSNQPVNIMQPFVNTIFIQKII